MHNLKYNVHISLSAVRKYFDYLVTHVIYRYKTERIQEYDMATHLLVLYVYTSYSKTGEVTDKGTLVLTIDIFQQLLLTHMTRRSKNEAKCYGVGGGGGWSRCWEWIRRVYF